MEMNKQSMLELRERLDKTLACDDLVNQDSIRQLVLRQFSLSPSNESADESHENSNEYVIERRSKEVKNFLDIQRSASGDHHNKPGGWKVKENNDEYRVMYRQGQQGTPFHTLLVEGYADAPVDVCICAGWETALYRKWWPQITIPTFRVTEARLLQKIRIGEHLSLTRMKVTWPLSAREVILHYMEIEYFEGDLVIGLLNTVSDIDKVTVKTHGFSNEGIPEAKDIVRMGLIGGTVMQKVSTNKTYFRTLATLDLKLDFAPAWLINFIARQLMGGTCELYQKTVASVAKGDADFEKALKGPLYVRIREGLYSGKNGESTLALSEQHETEEGKMEPDSTENEVGALEPVESGFKEDEEQENEAYSKGKKEDANNVGLQENEEIDTKRQPFKNMKNGFSGMHSFESKLLKRWRRQ